MCCCYFGVGDQNTHQRVEAGIAKLVALKESGALLREETD